MKFAMITVNYVISVLKRFHIYKKIEVSYIKHNIYLVPYFNEYLHRLEIYRLEKKLINFACN